MAQQTALSVMAIPGPVHSFVAKTAADQVTVSTRFDIVGINTKKFKLEGTDDQKFGLEGTSTKKFSLVGI